MGCVEVSETSLAPSSISTLDVFSRFIIRFERAHIRQPQSISLGVDASKFDPDKPLPPVPETNASKSGQQRVIALAEREGFTVRQLADMVVELTGTKAKVISEPLPQDDPKVRKPDITRAKQILGWQPTIPRKEGLRKMVEHYRDELAPKGSNPREKTLTA